MAVISLAAIFLFLVITTYLLLHARDTIGDMLALIFIAFTSGLFTILAPSIWPLLPIILSTSATDKGSRRPFLVTAGILFSFILFTLSISLLTQSYQIDHSIFRIGAIAALCFIGVSLLWPPLNQWAMRGIHKVAFFTTHNNFEWDNGYIGDLITGILLGLIWSPFAGPALEPIASLVNQNQLGWQVLVMILAYVAGIGVPLFGVALGGSGLTKLTHNQGPYFRASQIFFGCTTLLSAIFIVTGIDLVVQKIILDIFATWGITF